MDFAHPLHVHLFVLWYRCHLRNYPHLGSILSFRLIQHTSFSSLNQKCVISMKLNSIYNLLFFQSSKIKHQAITYYWLKGNILRRMVISTIFKRPNFRIFYSVTRRGTVWLGMILTWNIADTITTFPQVWGLRV